MADEEKAVDPVVEALKKVRAQDIVCAIERIRASKQFLGRGHELALRLELNLAIAESDRAMAEWLLTIRPGLLADVTHTAATIVAATLRTMQ